MLELADLVRAAGPAYVQAHAGHLSPPQRRALTDIAQCRTPALGGSLYVCDDCGTLDYAYHSCRNRHCPTCQEERTQDWLTRVSARLLPCDHYLLTFTLPQQLRLVARDHQTLIYDALLREAAASVQTLAADPKWVGATPGILAVLHTWSRTLDYHPHAHLIVTAGGLSDDSTWIKPAHADFLMPGYALSHVFRAKMRDALARLGLTDGLDPRVWTRRWTVHIQHIGRGHHAAHYLSRYVYRVALTNHSLIRFADGTVTFRYTHGRTGEPRQLTLPVDTFLTRFLQHVLPRAFTKVRSYGLLSSTNRPKLEEARRLLELHAASTACVAPSTPSTPSTSLASDTASAEEPPPAPPTAPPSRTCPACRRATMRLLHHLPRTRGPPW